MRSIAHHLRVLGTSAAVIALVVAATPAAQAAETVRISDADRKTYATAHPYAPVNDPYVYMEPRAWDQAQVWHIRKHPKQGDAIINAATNGCLNVAAVGPVDPRYVVQRPCTGGLSEAWRIDRFSIDGTVRIVSIASGDCLSQAPPTTADRRLRAARCDGSYSQRFRLVADG